MTLREINARVIQMGLAAVFLAMTHSMPATGFVLKGPPPALLLAGRRGGMLVRRQKQRARPMAGEDNENADEQMTQLLLQVGRSRDVDAFEALFRHFGPRIKAFMARVDRGRAEELMQETMMTVWRKADLFDTSRGVAASWIFTIARNQRIDALRRDRRAELDPDDPALVPETPIAADHALDNLQNAKLMREALAELPSEQLQVLELAFYQEQSQSEIATHLALPLGTVKSRMRLGFAKLRAALANGGKQS